MWMTAFGIVGLQSALKLKSAGLPWGWAAILEILCLLVGLYSFVHPVVAAFTIGGLLGLQVMAYGWNLLIFGVMLPTKRKQ
jgi:uncharacterized membrane protein HdeD (DUF308 family)